MNKNICANERCRKEIVDGPGRFNDDWEGPMCNTCLPELEVNGNPQWVKREDSSLDIVSEWEEPKPKIRLLADIGSYSFVRSDIYAFFTSMSRYED